MTSAGDNPIKEIDYKKVIFPMSLENIVLCDLPFSLSLGSPFLFPSHMLSSEPSYIELSVIKLGRDG
jgi:hypothetical protein